MPPASFRARTAILAAATFWWGLAFAPVDASAFAHDWHFTEIYSNADGSVQFIELSTQSSGEGLLSLAILSETSFGHATLPGQDLALDTAGHSLLFATPGFAALPGAVQPDFVIPPGFFNRNGDTLQWLTSTGDIYGGGATLWDTLSFAAGELPSNGSPSLNRSLGSATQFVAANSPTNFAGQTGSLVPEPTAAALVLLGIIGLAMGRRHAP